MYILKDANTVVNIRKPVSLPKVGIDYRVEVKTVLYCIKGGCALQVG